MTWRPFVDAACAVLAAAAAPLGPLPVAVVAFAGEAVKLAMVAAEEKRDPVATAQAICDRAVDLVERVKLGTTADG